MSSNRFSLATPLSRVRFLGSARSGTDHFIKQRLTALALVPLTVIVVLVAVSLVGKDLAQAKAILSRPLVAIPLLLFIVASVTHMRLGMQVIIEDYVQEELPKWGLLALNTFFAWAIGVACAFAVAKLSFGM